MYNDEIPAEDIRRGKIIKYSFAALLGLTLVGCSGIEIYDVDIDHTKEICLKTKIIDTLSPKDEENMSIGVDTHQIPEMIKELKEQGYNDAKVSYQKNNDGYEITEYANYNYETNTFDYQETINLSK